EHPPRAHDERHAEPPRHPRRRDVARQPEAVIVEELHPGRGRDGLGKRTPPGCERTPRRLRLGEPDDHLSAGQYRSRLTLAPAIGHELDLLAWAAEVRAERGHAPAPAPGGGADAVDGVGGAHAAAAPVRQETFGLRAPYTR